MLHSRHHLQPPPTVRPPAVPVAPNGKMPAQNAAQAEAQRRLLHWLELEQSRRQVDGQPGRIDSVRERLPGQPGQGGQADFHYRYDAHGDLVEIVEPDGRSTRYAYDPARRLVCVTHPDGASTHYTYGHDRLLQVDDRGWVTHFAYDPAGRLTQAQRGDEAAVYRYDQQGRVTMARTARVTTEWGYDGKGHFSFIRQALDGANLTARLEYDQAGRLSRLWLPGCARPVSYTWDLQGRPQTVSIGEQAVARYQFDEARKTTRVIYGNGITAELAADRLDGRPRQLTIRGGETVLFQQAYEYGLAGEILEDGSRAYTYDFQGRLASVRVFPAVERLDQTASAVAPAVELPEPSGARSKQTWRYAYDALDNRTSMEAGGRTYRYDYDPRGCLASVTADDNQVTWHRYDAFGRLVGRLGPQGEWTYTYDGSGCLREVRRQGDRVASFTYDHKGRLVLAELPDRTERYLYGPADELFAVTDAQGNPLRLMVGSPLGPLAEVHLGEALVCCHPDPQGTSRLLTDASGAIIARFDYDPFGLPTGASGPQFYPAFASRLWYPEIGLYCFGARWYDPTTGRFLTPDSYTGAPDDERLINPSLPADRQPSVRGQILNAWLKQPRLRNRYAFCSNDPVGRVDPNGHWSFGGVLLSLLGAIWTLPNTLFGLLVEVTCLIGEVVRWLVWLVSFGHATWETPGFDAAASGNLNAFALVFTGGWLGSFSKLLGITFGNVFFVYKDWENSEHIKAMPDPVYPPAYNGKVAIPRDHVLYEHELRHTNQYGWLGPFFHLGLPVFGFYEWDVIINGYRDAWSERDARAHAEQDPKALPPGGTPGSPPGDGGTPPPGGGTPPAPGGGPTLPTTSAFSVDVRAVTRLGGIPVTGVKVQVDTQDLGASNGQGRFTVAPSLSGNAFTVTASYANSGEHLRKEELVLAFSGVDPAAGTYQVAVSNQIIKVQDVAGKGDKEFKQTYTLDQTSTSGEVQYDATAHRFTISLKLATLSLNVPYFNQNSQSDSVTTVVGKDPEPSSHEVTPRFTGGILCFPSSVHMLLKYWGVDKSRAQVMQKTYELWAAEGFPERLDKSGTTKSAAPPASPADGQRWLDTSTVTSSGYKLKTWKSSSNSWEEIADTTWRIQKGSYKIWTIFAYEQGALEAFRPADTVFNGKVDDATELANLPDNILTDTYKPHFRDKLAAGLPIVISTTATAGHIMIMRGAVVDKDLNVQWFIFNDPFGTLAAPGSIYEPIDLSASVGKGGSNQAADVTAVQEILKALNYYTGEVNGVCDGSDSDATVKAIQKFQKNKMGDATPDGLVEPDGGTETALNKLDFSSYKDGEDENNSNSATGEEAVRGKHVYYNEQTHGVGNHLEIKGKWRGVVMLKKTTPFTPEELAARLTPGA
jgi:RHS repeat-associated protein